MRNWQCKDDLEVDRIMGGYIFKTDVDEGIEKGMEKGIKKGIKKGREEGEKNLAELIKYLLTNGREKDALKAASDGEYRKKLMKEFQELAVQG